MQRRNVDFPDPDGPSRHITSPRRTSRLMPLSTSRLPNRLWTPSDLTIGSLIAHALPCPMPSHRARIVIRWAREKPRPKRRSMKYWPT